jgi:protease IV
MKNIFGLLLVLLLLPAAAFAQWEGVELGALDLSSAGIDNLFIPQINPALLGTGHAGGLGWAHMYDDMEIKRHYWLFANMDALSYNYEYTRNALGNGLNYHTLATGMELLPRHILPNLYAGASYRWKNSGFGKGDWRTAFTYRPHPSSSVAFSWDNPYKESPAYHAGLAVRPLAFVPGVKDHRLELSFDMDYGKEDGDYGFREPVVGLQTRILDGLNLGATYNLDKETAFLNFSFSTGKTEIGSMVHVEENDHYAIPYIHLTDDVFPPFLGLGGRKWYDMKLKGNVVTYEAPKHELGPIKIYDKDTHGIEELIARIRKAGKDPSVQGILLKNPGFSSSWTLQQELVSALQEFKCGGRKIAMYYDNISNGGYIFASSVADNIYLNPMGSVNLRGISISSPYLKDLLDHLGVDVLNFRSHKYKNAGNMLSESEMTPAEREVYESLLQSLYDQMTTAINAGRGDKLQASAEETVDGGPYFLAQDALDTGLVDCLVYEDELNKKLREDFGFNKKESGLTNYRDYAWSHPKQNLIAVIYASGNIVMGKGTPGKKIAHETTVNLIRKARKDDSYKGIILRVDSGGGSAQASDIILRELQLAQDDDKKPVVVSMTGVAASGGYYISCGADRIIAGPSTLTGSIGVIGLGLSIPRLLDKIKVNWSTVRKGEHADFGSIYRSWTEDEKTAMDAHIEAVYEDFVGKVAAGRDNLTLEDVHAIAQGRVWTGEQALANGLIDDLGGLDKAIEHIRDLSGIKGDIILVDATTKKEGFSVQIDSDALPGFGVDGILGTLAEDYVLLYELWRDYQGENVLMLSPLEAEKVDF